MWVDYGSLKLIGKWQSFFVNFKKMDSECPYWRYFQFHEMWASILSCDWNSFWPLIIYSATPRKKQPLKHWVKFGFASKKNLLVDQLSWIIYSATLRSVGVWHSAWIFCRISWQAIHRQDHCGIIGSSRLSLFPRLISRCKMKSVRQRVKCRSWPPKVETPVCYHWNKLANALRSMANYSQYPWAVEPVHVHHTNDKHAYMYCN